MKRTSWQPVSGWYDTAVGAEGDYTHREIVIPNTVRMLDLVSGARLVDLGCGQGILARSIPRTIAYTGIDIAPALISAARIRDQNPAHRYYVGDATGKLPVADREFTHAAAVLALDNIEHPDRLMGTASDHLRPGGCFLFVINHPCFRIPRQSGWEIDERNKIQYRRLNRYLSPLSIPITAHPGKGQSSPVTWTFHYPVGQYVRWLSETGFATVDMEEWVSVKHSVGKAASMENRARAEFPLFLAVKARKL
jgi:SAM-dependent methyltransferase